jgi:hypothetical protein
VEDFSKSTIYYWMFLNGGYGVGGGGREMEKMKGKVTREGSGGEEVGVKQISFL